MDWYFGEGMESNNMHEKNVRAYIANNVFMSGDLTGLCLYMSNMLLLLSRLSGAYLIIQILILFTS